ncbi:MAG: hypothetical protein ACP5MU_01455 [Thermoplasmata archaeon]
MVRLEIELTLRIKGKESRNAIESIMPENRKYMSFRKTKYGYICHISGDANNVRKTLNEFLESLMFIEKIAEVTDARVG